MRTFALVAVAGLAGCEVEIDPDFCSDDLAGGSPAGPDCLTGTIDCGDTISSTTKGGSQHFGSEHYENFYCLVPHDDYSSPERVYEIELSADTLATFELYSPCGDLDLIVLRWEEDSECPSTDQLITECESDVSDGSGDTLVWTDRDSRYLVIVDGETSVKKKFEISVTCESE